MTSSTEHLARAEVPADLPKAMTASFLRLVHQAASFGRRRSSANTRQQFTPGVKRFWNVVVAPVYRRPRYGQLLRPFAGRHDDRHRVTLAAPDWRQIEARLRPAASGREPSGGRFTGQRDGPSAQRLRVHACGQEAPARSDNAQQRTRAHVDASTTRISWSSLALCTLPKVRIVFVTAYSKKCTYSTS